MDAVDVTDVFWAFVVLVGVGGRPRAAMEATESFQCIAAVQDVRSCIRADVLVADLHRVDLEDLPRGVSVSGEFFVFCDINALLYGARLLVEAYGEVECGHARALEACMSKIHAEVDLRAMQASMDALSF